MRPLIKPKPISKWAHLSFLISMIGKGLLGLGQILGGLALALTPSGTLNGIVVRGVGGRRDSIILPATGLGEFKRVLDEMVRASEASPGKDPVA